jgi:hypothetical protein
MFTRSGKLDVMNRALIEYFGEPIEAFSDWGSNGTFTPRTLPASLAPSRKA